MAEFAIYINYGKSEGISTGVVDLRRLYFVLSLLSVFALVGCTSKTELEAAMASRDQAQGEVVQLQERTKELEARVQALESEKKALEAEVRSIKEAPQELLRAAVEARTNDELERAAQLLTDLAQKFPASPEASQVPGERERLDQVILAKRQADQADRIAAEEAKRPPIEITRAVMGENSIGTPEIYLTLYNRSGKVVDGFEFSVSLYDNYDRPVKRYRTGGNVFNGISQDKIRSGDSVTWVWTLYGYDLATKYTDLQVESVHFTDGTLWRPPGDI